MRSVWRGWSAPATSPPAELVDGAIERLQALDPKLQLLVSESFDRARKQAAGDLPDGPFRGVPFLLKDAVQHSEGDPYGHGLAALKGSAWRSPHDTELTRRYRQAGLVLLGRTKVPELTMSSTTEPLGYGPAHNPWSLGHSPGGSSGGSAAAVAAGIVPVAHGNDMGGSIRIPASCCGAGGPQAEPRPHQPRARPRRVLGTADARARHHPHGPRQRRRTRRHGRIGARRSARGPAAEATLAARRSAPIPASCGSA